MQEVPECPNVLAKFVFEGRRKWDERSFGEEGGYEEAFAVIHLRESAQKLPGLEGSEPTLETSGVITSHSAKTIRSPTEGVFG